MTDYFGSCLCGAVKFRMTGEFDSFYLCHCQYCQKDTGSAHAANLFSQSAKLTFLTGEDSITTFMLPGTSHIKKFSKLCGSALPSRAIENQIVIPAGCLDTEVSKTPTAHIFISSSAFWDQALETLPKFKGLPT